MSCTCYSPHGSWRDSINTSVSSCPLLFSKLSKRFSSHSRVKGKVLHNMVHSLHSLSLSDPIPYHSTETLHQRAVFPFSGTFLKKHTPFLFLAMTPSQHVGSSFPNQRCDPSALLWKLGVLTPGLPVKSPGLEFLFAFYI